MSGGCRILRRLRVNSRLSGQWLMHDAVAQSARDGNADGSAGYGGLVLGTGTFLLGEMVRSGEPCTGWAGHAPGAGCGRLRVRCMGAKCTMSW